MPSWSNGYDYLAVKRAKREREKRARKEREAWERMKAAFAAKRAPSSTEGHHAL